jgi:hypothetical protein
LTPGCHVITETDAVQRRLKAFKRPQHYIAFSGRPLDDLVEYELDDEDADLLHALNSVLSLDSSARARLVTDDELEAVLSYFEFESFFQRDNSGVLARYAPYRDLYTEAEDEQETPCQVCNDPDYTDVNQIVFCDGCNLAVHQLCYGVAEIPAGSWLCRRCAQRDASRHNPPCRLCPLRGGAMWPCAGGVGWVHSLCALYMPGCTLAADVKLEDPSDVSTADAGRRRQSTAAAAAAAASLSSASTASSFSAAAAAALASANSDVVHGLDSVPAAYLGQRCSLCHETSGVSVRCSHPDCTQTAHVMCARRRGLVVDVVMTPTHRPQRIMYCRAHSMALQLHSPSANSITRDDLQQLAVGLMGSSNILEFPVPALELIYYYWRQRRRLHPQPLIPRLRRDRDAAARCALPLDEYSARFFRLRQAMEKARILVDLVGKREVVKQLRTENFLAVQDALERRAAAAAANSHSGASAAQKRRR